MKHVGSEPFFWEYGLGFKCICCPHCCRHDPGYVFLPSRDPRVLAKHCAIFDQSFVDASSVYTARPLQCRTYPFWPGILASEEDWIRKSRECPGIGIIPVHPKRRIASTLRQREREVLISPSR